MLQPVHQSPQSNFYVIYNLPWHFNVTGLFIYLGFARDQSGMQNESFVLSLVVFVSRYSPSRQEVQT